MKGRYFHWDESSSREAGGEDESKERQEGKMKYGSNENVLYWKEIFRKRIDDEEREGKCSR